MLQLKRISIQWRIHSSNLEAHGRCSPGLVPSFTKPLRRRIRSAPMLYFNFVQPHAVPIALNTAYLSRKGRKQVSSRSIRLVSMCWPCPRIEKAKPRGSNLQSLNKLYRMQKKSQSSSLDTIKRCNCEKSVSISIAMCICIMACAYSQVHQCVRQPCVLTYA